MSTPDLTLDLDGAVKLERTNAVRRKPGGRGGDQTVISACLTSLDDNSSANLGPVAASTPTESIFALDTIQVVNDCGSC